MRLLVSLSALTAAIGAVLAIVHAWLYAARGVHGDITALGLLLLGAGLLGLILAVAVAGLRGDL
jgi:hypothetical protein